MPTKDSQQDLTPLVSDLIVKESDTLWFSQGLEALLIAVLILAVVFSVLYVLVKKSPINKLTEQATNTNIKILSSQKITRSTSAVVIRWRDSEYLLVEKSQSVKVVDKKEVEVSNA